MLLSFFLSFFDLAIRYNEAVVVGVFQAGGPPSAATSLWPRADMPATNGWGLIIALLSALLISTLYS
jgi:hypothetical protein